MTRKRRALRTIRRSSAPENRFSRSEPRLEAESPSNGTARAPKHPSALPTATERLTRLLYFAVGVTALIFGGFSLPEFSAQLYAPAPFLSIVGWMVGFGIPMALGILSQWAPLGLLRVLAALQATGFLVSITFWLLFRADPLYIGGGTPWVLLLTGLPAVVVAIIAPGALAWSYTVLVALLSGYLRTVTSLDAQPALIGLQETLYTLLFQSVFVGLTLVTRRGAARVDAATRLARTAEIARAAATAREHERATIDALVHDSVISTLLMAGIGRVETGTVARHATASLAKLDALGTPAPEPVVLRSELIRRLERMLPDLAPQAVLRRDPAADPDLPGSVERTLPAPAAAALLDAAGEALRNSVKYAGPHAALTVTVHAPGGGVQLDIADTGTGFDPALVPTERLGIARSILERMSRIPGASATVRSAPGNGTTVTLTWLPHPAPPAEPAASAAPRTVRRSFAAKTAFWPSKPRPDAPTPSNGTYPDPDLAPAPETPRAFARSFGLSTHLARNLVRTILVLFIVVYGVLAFADPYPGGAIAALPLDVIAYIGVCGAAIAVTLPGPDPIPHRQAVAILLMCAVAGTFMFVLLRPFGLSPFATWHLGAISLILMMLIARGRARYAWAGFLLLATGSILWAHLHSLGPAFGIDLVTRHAATLLAGTLFLFGLRHSAGTLAVLQQAGTRRAADEATAQAGSHEREAQLARVNTLARPALELLGAGDPTTAADRAEFLIVEASLRDAIRGRSLFIEPLIAACRAARARGVEVSLLDDSADSADRNAVALPVLAAAVARELDTVPSGRFTARVLPAGRADLATILIDSLDKRMLRVAPDGTLHDL